MCSTRIFFFDEIFSAGDEVFPGVRLRLFFPGEVPFFAVLTAAAYARHRDNAATLQPWQKTRSEEWFRVGYAVRAIAIQQNWVCAVALQASLVKNDQRDHRAVVTLGFD